MNAYNELILVVDDQPEVATTHAQMVRDIGYKSLVVTEPEEVEPYLDKKPEIDLILLDIRMPKIMGTELLKRIKIRRPDMGVIMATVVNDIAESVKATKAGAYNYLVKPLQSERLREVLKSYFSNRPRTLSRDPKFSCFVTGCRMFEEIFKRVVSFAKANVPVLISGETGTGKELIAQLIHALSPRSLDRFLAINIAALPSNLFESELFGHSKGAFTGAVYDRSGYMECAGKGTLFMDEIGELAPEQQKKLLRVLETHKYCRIGETNERTVEACLLFATNKDLQDEIEKQNFREDLYYRINAHVIHLPPLRERAGDIELLSNYFLEKYCSQFGHRLQGFAPEAMELLKNYSFPGNIRELDGIISSVVLLEQGTIVRPSSLPPHLQHRHKVGEDLGAIKYQAIIKALREYDGNQTKAAMKLGISRGTLNRLIRDYRDKGLNI